MKSYLSFTMLLFLINALLFGTAFSQWSNIGDADGDILAIAVHNNTLYVGGKFTTIGGQSIRGLAKFVNGNWQKIGNGIGGDVYTIAFASNGDMYVGGWFNEAGQQSNVWNIAKWDGNYWHRLGNGLNGRVKAITIDGNNNVYAGGDFLFTGDDLYVNHIAKWDGSSWSDLTGYYGNNLQTGVNGTVNALCTQYSNYIWVGGDFYMREGADSRGNGLMIWRGNYWDWTVTGPGPIKALAEKNGTVYIGGQFSNGIAYSYNGSTIYYNLGSVNSTVYSIAVSKDNDDIYIGGNFTTAGNTAANRVAKWNSNTEEWEALDNGVNNDVLALGYMSVPSGAYGYPDLYVGGKFTEASGVSAQHLARYALGNDQQAPPPSNNKTGMIFTISKLKPNEFRLGQNYPNPFNPETNIQYSIARESMVSLKVYDINGKEITTLVNQVQKPGTYRVKYIANDCPAGIYFYRIKAGEYVEVKKMILVK